MTETCRFCGENKYPTTRSSYLDADIINKLETYFKITIDTEKLLPNFICENCNKMIFKSYDFLQKIVDVQIILKNNVLMELNKITISEFINFEVKIEKLDEIPHIPTSSKTVKVEKDLPEILKVGKKNRGVKMEKAKIKYTMEDIFEVKINLNIQKLLKL